MGRSYWSEETVPYMEEYPIETRRVMESTSVVVNIIGMMMIHRKTIVRYNTSNRRLRKIVSLEN